MSSSEADMPHPTRKRGIVNKSEHKKEKMKIARREGKAYTNNKGTLVPAKTAGPDCECRGTCINKFREQEKSDIIINLYSRASTQRMNKIHI